MRECLKTNHSAYAFSQRPAGPEHAFKNAGSTIDWALEKNFNKAFIDHRDDKNMKKGAAYLGPYLIENLNISALSSHHGVVVAILCVLLVASQSIAVIKTATHSSYRAKYAERRAEAFFGPVSAFSDKAVVKSARCHSEELCVYVRGIVDQYGLMKQGRDKVNQDD